VSNKSGISSQVISLPKGGGALHGIGEKFSPDLHTGTGNFTVPIALPSGRNGFQPQLNLVYSTGNGNGPFGLGWGLSIPGVCRTTSQGIPRYEDERDTFVLSGAEDLVPVEQKPGATRYRPRTEGLFARILHHRNAGNNHWEVRSKDGLVSIYGTPGTAGNDPATVANPADRSRVFAWNLTRTEDPFGNRIEYLYERDATQTDGAHHWVNVISHRSVMSITPTQIIPNFWSRSDSSTNSGLILFPNTGAVLRFAPSGGVLESRFPCIRLRRS
jgi:Salmonella virulence plasmid 65kDa B protein